MSEERPVPVEGFASIRIGGVLVARDLPALHAAAEADRTEEPLGALGNLAQFTETVLDADGALELECHEASEGSLPALEDFCLKRGLTFVAMSEAGPVHSNRVLYWRPGLGEPYGVAVHPDHGAMVYHGGRWQSLSEPDEAQEALARFGLMPLQVPALAVVDDSTTVNDGL